MADNFINSGWVNNLRAISSHIDVIPSIDNGDASTQEAVIVKGGINNTIKNLYGDNGIIIELGSYENLNKIYCSKDSGKTWEEATGTISFSDSESAKVFSWVKCKHYEEFGQFVALGYYGEGLSDSTQYKTYLYVSTNGTEWTETSVIDEFSACDFDISPQGIVVMVDQLKSKIMYSYMFNNWKEITSHGVSSPCSVYYDEIDEYAPYFLVASRSSSYACKKLRFGMPMNGDVDFSYSLNISSPTISGLNASGIMLGHNVIIPQFSIQTAYDSTYGEDIRKMYVRFIYNTDEDDVYGSWGYTSQFTLTGPSKEFLVESVGPRIIYGNNKLCFSADGYNAVLYSEDFGVTWKTSNTINDNEWCKYGIEFNGKKFISVAGNYRIYESIDCVTWISTDNYAKPVTVNTSSSAIVSFQRQVICYGDFLKFDGLLTYDSQKSLGYFDGENVSIQLSKYSLVSNKIEYSSEVYSDEYGNIDGSVIDLYMNGTNCRYLEIVGDIARGEYPKNFTINTGLEEIVVTNNNLVHCIVDFGEKKSISNKITITITKWSTPYTSVKLNYIGTDIKYSFSKNNILKSYELHNESKDYSTMSYGLKYNDATISLYNDEYSVGSIISSINGETKRFKPLNIVQLLLECQIDSLFKFYVKTSYESSYHLIGKYYSNRIEYNTQSDVVTISLYDICNRFQGIEYGGPAYKGYFNTIKSGTLTDVLTKIKEDLANIYNINFDISNKYSDNIVIDKVVFTAETLWQLLEQCCGIGLFYIVADHTREDVDIKIFDRR